MLRRLGFALLLTSLALLIASSALAIPVARMQLWSEPGDPIGERQTFDVIHETDLGEGEFTLFEYVRSGFPLSKMVLEFTQYANHSPAALRGRIEFDAAGLINIPEPSAALLMLLGLAGLSGRRRST